MKLPLRTIQLSWKATVALAAAAAMLIALIGLTLGDSLSLALQLGVVAGLFLVLWRHSVPRR